jgi:probable phosphoglycerate mutase
MRNEAGMRHAVCVRVARSSGDRQEGAPVARPELWLCRHGETDWSRDGRHTSHTDLLLTPAGVDDARRLAGRLAGLVFDLVLTSPMRRARDTAELVGFPDARRDPALAEWDYGDYEGMTTAEIRERVPGWTVWSHESPGGEGGDQVALRADRVIDRVLAGAADRALLVSHGHFLRVLAARWLGQGPSFGRHLLLGTASLSVLGWEREARAITRWNVPVAPQPGFADAPTRHGGDAERGAGEAGESGSGAEAARP